MYPAYVIPETGLTNDTIAGVLDKRLVVQTNAATDRRRNLQTVRMSRRLGDCDV